MSSTTADTVPDLQEARLHGGNVNFEQARTLELLYRNLRTGSLLSILTIILTAFLLDNIVNGPHGRSLMVWVGVGLIIEVGRLQIVRQFSRFRFARPYRYWWQIHHTMAAVSGLYFAYLPAAMFVHADSAGQIIMTITIIGSVATATGMNVASPVAFSCFAYLASLPLIVQYALRGDPASIGIASLITTYVIGATYACDEVTRLIRRNLALTSAFHAKVVNDASVGMLNREAFFAQVQAAAYASESTGDDVAILLIDLDHFASLNEYRGRADGDRTLQFVGSTIISSIRRADIAGRLGADEFAVLLSPSSARGASIVAENIQRSIANLRISLGPDNKTLAASIGIGVTVRGEVNLDELLAAAAHACELAKKNGRNKFEVLIATEGVRTQRGFRLVTA
ncbi:MAG: diguanylate cyclase [Burkholderiaceae bacterium]